MNISTTSVTRLSISLAVVLLLHCRVQSVGAQWEQTNGPYGGFVRAISYDGHTTWAGTIGSGLFRSSDNGKSWSFVDGTAGASIYDILTVGSSMYFAGKGVTLTTDNGASWTPSLTAKGVVGLTMFDTSVVAITTAGIYVAPKGTIAWRSLSPTSSNFSGLAGVQHNAKLYIGTSTGLYRLKEGETKWTQLTTGYTTAVTFSGDSIFAGTTQGLMISADDGADWATVSSGPMIDTLFVWKLAFMHGKLFAATTTAGCMVSSDNGGTWAKVPGYPGDVLCYCMGATPSSVIFGGPFGIDGSSDLQTWSVWNNGITGISGSALAVNGSTLYAATGDSMYSTTDNGRHWQPAFTNVSLSYVNKILFHNGATYIADAGYGVYYSPDNGASWTLRNEGISSIKIWSIMPYDRWLLAGTYPDGGYRSSDGGLNWSPTPGMENWGVSAYAAGKSALWAAGASGIYKSLDTGATWDIVTDLPSTYGYWVESVNDTLFAVPRSDGVYRSTDDGATWDLPTESLPSYSIETMTSYNDLLFAAGEQGVAVSSDRGATWMDASERLPLGPFVYALTVSGTDLMVATDNGFFRRPLAQFRSLDVPAAWKPSLSLAVGPNPTSGLLQLRGSAIQNSTITVTDLSGNELGRFTNGTSDLASYDLSKLPAGQYFISATSHGQSITRGVIRR